MAQTVRPKTSAPADTSLVDRGIAAVARQVRTTDLLNGAAALAVVALGYVLLAILLDKWLGLPGWARQAGFVGFLAAFAAVGYRLVVRPLRQAVNPRYVARQVEATIPDAKNVLINYVDLQESPLPGAVKSAVGAKAAEGLADADVPTATRSKRLAWLGGVAAGLVAALVLLFVLFKSSQFLSLLTRAVNPFTSAAIASQTAIDLVTPAGGDATVTDGEELNVLVQVGGALPDPKGANKVRLLVRRGADQLEPEEVPLEKGKDAREFTLTLTRAAIQNGFWYTVAAGDARSPEHRVDVRTRPLVKGYEARYEYPAYLRMTPDTGHEPKIEAHRGTKVTLTVRTNRTKVAGWMDTRIDGIQASAAGEPCGENGDSLRFNLVLDKSGTYEVRFTSKRLPGDTRPGDETGNSPEQVIEVLVDRPPTVTIGKPEPDEVAIPANGLLAVDGVAGDDFGLTAVELKLRRVNGGKPLALQGRKFNDGKPLLRDTDKTYPMTVDYADSAKPDELKDEGGKPAGIKEGDVLEYWLEATDNCTEPGANVGKSVVKRVKVGAAVTQPEQKKQQDDRRQQRKADEKQKNQQQADQRKAEKRPPPQQPQHDAEQQPQQNPDQQQGGDKSKDPNADPKGKPDQGGGQPMGPNAQPTGMKDPPPTDPNSQPMNPMAQPNDPSGKPMSDPMANPNGGAKDPPPNGKPQDGKDDVQKQADELQKKIDDQNRHSGDGRSDGTDGGTPPTDAKHPDKPAGEQKGKTQQGGSGAADAKAAPPEGDPKGGDSKANPAESKGEGGVQQPEKASEKPQPSGDPNAAKPDQQPTGGEPKAGPKENQPAAGSKESKPQSSGGDPKADPMNPAGSPDQKNKDASGGDARGARPKPKDADPKGNPQPDPMSGGSPDRQQPNGGDQGSKPDAGAKPKGDVTRGQPKPQPKESGQPGGDPTATPPESEPKGSEPKVSDQNGGGDARGDKPMKPSEKKDAPKGAGRPSGDEKPQPSGDPMTGGDGASQPKDGGKEAGTPKAEQKPTPGGGSGDKPDPKEKTQPNGSGSGSEKPDPKQVEQDIRDLGSPDAKKQQDARDRLDKQFGKANREKAEQLQKDLKSEDKGTREKAEQQVKDMADKAAKDAEKNGEKNGEKNAGSSGKPSKEEMDKLAQAAKDLNSKDDAKRQAAEQTLDKAVGEKDRKELQQAMKDAQGDDKQKADAAKEKLEEMAKKNGGGTDKPDEKMDAKQVEQAMKDLGSDDKAKRDAAREKLDKQVGKETREKAERLQQDLKSGDPVAKNNAQKQIEEMAKQGQKNADPKGQPQPSKEDAEKLAQAAKDLASKDDAKRQAAEQKLDEAVGEQNRKELQQDVKDLQGNDPAKADAAKERLQKKIDDLKAKGGPGKTWQPGGGGFERAGEALKDDPENRLKTAEQQLATFKEKAKDKDFLKDANMDEEQYRKFLDGFEKRVAELRDAADRAKAGLPPEEPGAAGPTTVGRNAADGGRVEGRTEAGTLTGVGGAAVAPPGFADAKKRFAEEAAKRRGGK